MRDLGQVAYPLGASVMVRLLCPLVGPPSPVPSHLAKH